MLSYQLKLEYKDTHARSQPLFSNSVQQILWQILHLGFYRLLEWIEPNTSLRKHP